MNRKTMKTYLRQIVLLAIVLLTPGWVSAASLLGKVTVETDPVAGVTVLAYPADTLDFQPATAYRSPLSKDDGLFAMDIPSGQYYLLADHPDWFAYYGRNPVTVPEEGLADVNLLMVAKQGPVGEMPTAIDSGVTGIVTQRGQPVAGALVSVYPDLSSQFKGMGMAMSAPTDERGFFELPLGPGRYYLVVRVRQSGLLAGPLKAGDLFGYLPQNPLLIDEKQVLKLNFPVIEVPEQVDRYANTLFGNTRITGQILDTKGEPVAGLQAMLYDDATLLNRPLYVSRTTAKDGRYVLSFPQGGRYYLAARDQLGGTPAPGELYGRYQGSSDHSVQIETGQVLTGVDIIVDEVY
jgi:hypothetical protein